MHWIKKFDDGLGRMEARLIVALLTGMIVLSFFQIIMRNFFHSGISWGDILLRHATLWTGLIGASLATQQSHHLSIEFTSYIIPSRWARSLGILIKLFASAVCVALTFYACDFVRYEQEGGAMLIFETPTWIFQLVIPYSFAMISFRFLLSAIPLTVSPLKEES
jgi:TRAP-type C4-dicarboxylate transport system permease small subunit